ncbi:DUF302 domain-containing protein [Williamwhitmania taraxaci]|uniref:DUF302 domain-containing protein n=1 Tax=Williamwhitmania taraxaci TaxID=1640674 RepID=A0A1G6HET1_9BACT|nr:DUF302 domain-containing protein [Williamwhitmania taraxaci]SDB92731.1 protein of unknown function DUF302 [Williamwhitmania taraxaci]
MNANRLIIEHVSPYDVTTTVEKLVAVATLKEWQNPAIHNLQQSLAKAGKEVLPVQVIEICKPEYSGKMLEKSDERIVSVMMPCRISVYEKEDGKTYVALLNMVDMVTGLSPVALEAISGATKESMEIVKSVIGPF